jgi:hypothetical protein
MALLCSDVALYSTLEWLYSAVMLCYILHPNRSVILWCLSSSTKFLTMHCTAQSTVKKKIFGHLKDARKIPLISLQNSLDNVTQITLYYASTWTNAATCNPPCNKSPASTLTIQPSDSSGADTGSQTDGQT